MNKGIKNVGKNLKEKIDTSKPHKQAVTIGLNVSGKKKKNWRLSEGGAMRA